MGIMTQDNFIFHGTVRDNIMYGKLDATEEEMIAAAKAVNAHDFIMKLENGYDTVLKEKRCWSFDRTKAAYSLCKNNDFRS